MEQKTTTIKKMFFDCNKLKRMIGANSKEKILEVDIRGKEARIISILNKSETTRTFKETEFLQAIGVKGEVQEWAWFDGGFLKLFPGLSITTKLEEVIKLPEIKGGA